MAKVQFSSPPTQEGGLDWVRTDVPVGSLLVCTGGGDFHHGDLLLVVRDSSTYSSRPALVVLATGEFLALTDTVVENSTESFRLLKPDEVVALSNPAPGEKS